MSISKPSTVGPLCADSLHTSGIVLCNSAGRQRGRRGLTLRTRHVHRELRPEDTVLPCENEGSLVAQTGLITRHSETQHTKPDQRSAP